MLYPTTEQHARWKAEAEEMDMSLSAWVQAMTEAGTKKFNATVEPDETRRELRSQRRDLKDELDAARERISYLENQLHDTEAQAIEEHVTKNPGSSYAEILFHVQESAKDRTPKILDALLGDTLTHRDGAYYRSEE